MPEIIAIHPQALLADEFTHAADKHYQELIQTGILKTGLPGADIRARTTTYEDTIISTQDLTQALKTTLRQASLLQAAKQHPVVSDQTKQRLTTLAQNHELAIIGDLRTDTTHALLLAAGITCVTHILGQPATHGISTDAQLRELRSNGRIKAVISEQEALATAD